ncbi:MAG: alkaline phosphatase [Kiritimatiellia bacterium]
MNTKAFTCALIVWGFVSAIALEQASEPSGSRPPKNVILMISDGGGFNQFRAASLYLTGQSNGLACHAFPVKLAVSTFSANGKGYNPELAAADPAYVKASATDSAAAATAMATGHKTLNGALGVDSANRPLSNVVEAASASGRAAGLVTSVPFSHATPAGFGAHLQDRGQYAVIAEELITKSPLTVLMGCGHPLYDANGRSGKMKRGAGFVGGPDLWEKISKTGTNGAGPATALAAPWTLVEDRAAFVALATGAVPARVLGVAKAAKTLQQERVAGKDWSGDGKIDAADSAAAPAFGDPFLQGVPTLAEMTRAALNVLDDRPRGFFLMIEGGAVDWAGHDNQTGRMIEEMAGFNDAIRAVCEWVEANGGWEQTLLVVTADHETGYLQGPGEEPGEKGKMPALTWRHKGHTNQLVPLFAKGWYSDRFASRVKGTDPLRGDYVDNTDIGRILIDTLNVP